jgi:6-phosphofructokinase 1
MVKFKKIGVLTSGGDCPGLNAAIRAVVRTCNYYKIHVKGILNGYDGLIDGRVMDFSSKSVSNILQRGGTILKTARSERFSKKESRAVAYKNLTNENIDGLIVLGGDGSFRGITEFTNDFDISVIGIPKTIDNDIYGTDFAIGFDTALNTVIQAVDKIRDTADSHNRLFFIEVMGRDAGMIAIHSGIAGGAEAILIPETETRIEQLVKVLRRGWKREKSSMIVIVAEGDERGGAYDIAKEVKAMFSEYDTRVTVLGHIQRGGSPTCADRVLASRLGVAAVEGLLEGRRNQMAGLINNEVVFTDFKDVVSNKKKFPSELMRIAEILSL